MANSFASLSTAIAWGALVLAVLAVVVGVAWAKIVAAQAENEARTEAAKYAKAYIDTWLVDVAQALVRTHVEYLHSTTISGEADERTADKLGEAAG